MARKRHRPGRPSPTPARRPRPPAQDGRIRLPSGRTTEITRWPDPAMTEWMSADRKPTPAETEYLREWLMEQSPEYQDHAIRSALAAVETERRIGEYTERQDTRLRDTARVAGRNMSRQFYTLLSGDQIQLCRHVRRLAPNPAVWLPWAPRKARCVACNDDILASIRDTEEDRRCDLCGVISDKLMNGTVLIPNVAISRVIMPVIIQYGACKRCINRMARECGHDA